MYKNYAEHMQTLTALYADEIAFLTERGWENARPVGTYGGCTALQAVCGGYSILATDGEHALIRDRSDETSTGWGISLYRSDEEIGFAEGETLEAAWSKL